MVANIGCQVMFTCLDGGLPPVDFQWLFNGMPVQAASDLLVRSTGELLLSNLQLRNAGNYSCNVLGQIQNTTGTAALSVLDPLFPPVGPSFRPFIVSSTPSRQILMDGQTAQFVCLVKGIPPPDIIWYRDRELLEEGDDVEIFEQGRVLTISNVTTLYEGMYECLVSNSEGSVSKGFELTIAGKHQMLIINIFIVIQPKISCRSVISNIEI